MASRILIAGLLLLSQAVSAGSPNVLEWTVQQPLDTTYKAVYEALEHNRFFVVFEVDIGDSLAGFAERWGEDYNRNELAGIRSLVFCNGWYANQVSNQDPSMLALCPLHLTIIHKAGESKVLFVRPGRVAEGSAAHGIATELEAAVVQAIERGLGQ